MMQTEETVEKMVSSAEQEEMEEKEEASIEEEGEDEIEDDEDLEGGTGKEEEGGMMEQAADVGESNPSSVEPKEKKMPEGLNLNNEVVMMRKEVKRLRALIIRKLTRQIAALKKKKGKDSEIERNQKRVDRLLAEMRAMKILAPDLVTKTALQKNLNFEQVCKNPKSSISDRAIARIATHPQFSKKIQDIKAAVKAFKEERMKAGKQTGTENVQKKAVKETPQSPNKKEEKQREKNEKDIKVELKETVHNEEEDSFLKDTGDESVDESESETETQKVTNSDDTQRKETPESSKVRPAAVKNSAVTATLANKPVKGVEKEPDVMSSPEEYEIKDDEESDLELSDDEGKQYFDDSTEERFHKQSSQSEDSDSGDDFFIGKKHKYKKKKEQKSVEEETSEKADPTDQVQSELDELESRLKSKAPPLQSVFCSLSKPGRRGGRGGGRGRGGDTFRDQEKPKRDFNPQRFHQQETGTDRNSGSKFSKPCPDGVAERGRGRGRSRGDFNKHSDRRGGGTFSHRAPQQALHPSWEASKKRKEQQGQILAFQGKKIKFDDDD